MYLKKLTKEKPENFQIFCFPYAGASPYIFSSWSNLMPANVGIWGIQYWPRGQNLEIEPPENQLKLMAEAIVDEMLPLIDRPYALFGHSMGSLLAYEISFLLGNRADRQPEVLFISSSRAPHRELPNPLNKLDDLEFRRRIIELKGIPEEILNSENLIDQMFYRLRKDFIACENYRVSQFEPIKVPLRVFAGRLDNLVEFSSVEAWRLHAGTAYSLTVLEGNHFHIHSQKNLLINLVKNELGL